MEPYRLSFDEMCNNFLHNAWAVAISAQVETSDLSLLKTGLHRYVNTKIQGKNSGKGNLKRGVIEDVLTREWNLFTEPDLRRRSNTFAIELPELDLEILIDRESNNRLTLAIRDTEENETQLEERVRTSFYETLATKEIETTEIAAHLTGKPLARFEQDTQVDTRSELFFAGRRKAIGALINFAASEVLATNKAEELSELRYQIAHDISTISKVTALEHIDPGDEKHTFTQMLHAKVARQLEAYDVLVGEEEFSRRNNMWDILDKTAMSLQEEEGLELYKRVLIDAYDCVLHCDSNPNVQTVIEDQLYHGVVAIARQTGSEDIFAPLKMTIKTQRKYVNNDAIAYTVTGEGAFDFVKGQFKEGYLVAVDAIFSEEPLLWLENLIDRPIGSSNPELN